jgi:glycosyltransferase involved in cell wall biosynthesis
LAPIDRSVRPAHPRVSVVVPALNEADCVGLVLAHLPPGIFEVILIDGWSSDATIQRARHAYPGLRVLRQTRYGKGNALACGFAASRGDIIVMLDADGSADPAEISRFVAALESGADLAKGTRFAAGGESEDITTFRRLGNWCLNQLVNLLFGTSSTDLCYGYMAFWRDCLSVLAVAEDHFIVAGELEGDATGKDPRRPRAEVMRWGDGFEIETLLTVRAAAGRLRTVEVGSFEGRRLYGTSNLNAVTDGFRVLRTIASERQRLRRRRGPVTSPPAMPIVVDPLAGYQPTSLPALDDLFVTSGDDHVIGTESTRGVPDLASSSGEGRGA